MQPGSFNRSNLGRRLESKIGLWYRLSMDVHGMGCTKHEDGGRTSTRRALSFRPKSSAPFAAMLRPSVAR